VILWAFGDPAPPGLARTLRAMGVTALNCEYGIPSPWVKASGLPFYVGHASGKGFLYMRRRNWDPIFRKWYKTRSPSLLVRKPCLSDPAAFAAARARLEKTLQAVPPGRVLAVSLDDEISATRFIDPIDFCRSPWCLDAFRAWLQKDCPSPADLSRRWGTKVSSWKEALPPTTDGERDRTKRALYPENLSRWNDHLAFRDFLLADRVARLAQVSRRLRPSLPVGFLGGQAPAAWGGYDWSLLARKVSFLEAYDIGGAREAAASFAPPEARRVETLFLEEDPRAVRSRFYGMLSRGLSGVILWSSRKFLDPQGRPRGIARAMAPAFREAAGPLGRALAGSLPAPGPWTVALLESQASVRLHWWKDSLPDGRTWPRRFGSFETAHSTSMATRLSWIRLLEDLGLQARLVSPADLARGVLAGPARPGLLVLPRTVALGEGACRAIRAFVRSGGVVVADGETALYDEFLRRRRRGGLDGLFGIGRPADPSLWKPADRNGRPLAGAFSPEGLPILQIGILPVEGTVSRNSAGRNWCFSRAAGKGRAFYWNLSLVSYAALRERPPLGRGVRLARRLFSMAARAAGLEPPFQVKIPAGEYEWVPLERRARLARDGRLLWVVRVNLGKDGLARLGRRGPIPVLLEAGKRVSLRDLRAGESLGRGRTWKLHLDPDSLLLFQVQR